MYQKKELHELNDGNTVLTAAIIQRHFPSIDIIFSTYPSGHPLFSQPDSLQVASNTPLGLALKTGQYDLARRLIVEKQCDVHADTGNTQKKMINNAFIFFSTEPISLLHLCVVLLGSFDEANELVEIIKLLLERGVDTRKTFYGMTALALLEKNFQEIDFDLYRAPNRPEAEKAEKHGLDDFFRGHLGCRGLNVSCLVQTGNLSELTASLLDHCAWHRDNFRMSLIQRRNAYFNLPEGRNLRQELTGLLQARSMPAARR